MDEINIGIVGAGQNTRLRHIPGFRQIPGVNIVSVCNRTRQSSQKIADQYNIPNTHENWADLINDPETDAIMIGTWPYMHAEITIAALKAQKHVLCEARMASNLDQAVEMLQTSKKHPQLIGQIVPSPMTLPFDITIIETINSTDFGKVLAIDLQAGSSFIDYDRPATWREDKTLSGNNTMSLGIWYEAIMRWIGTAEQVMAASETFVKQRKSSPGQTTEIQIPDHLNVLAKFKCGAHANMRFSQVTGLAGDRLTIFGEKATLCFYQDNLLIGRKGDKELSPLKIKPENIQQWRVEQEFINAIRQKEKVKLTTFEDGVKYMEFTDAVLQSAQTGKAVELKL